MNLTVRRAIKSVAASGRPLRARSVRNHDSVSIFAYHRVVANIEKAEQEAFYGLVVSTDTFRKHCELLKRSFDVVSLKDAADVLSGKRSAKGPTAVITFDDGYLDFYEEAFPVLRSLQMPATVFLPTAYIGTGRMLDHDKLFWLLKSASGEKTDITENLIGAGVKRNIAKRFANITKLTDQTESLVYLPLAVRERVIAALEKKITELKPYPCEYQLLRWDQVSEMSAAGIDFGAHTANHVVLPIESEEMAAKEIAASRSTLERHLGKSITTFAYPNGEHNATIRQLAFNAGFKVAVTTTRHSNRLGSDPLALGRFSLCEESTRGLLGAYSPRVAALRLGA